MRPASTRKRRLFAGWAVVLGVVVGCSPVSRLKCRFELPKEAAPVDATRLHLRAAAACPHYGGEPPPPQPAPPAPGLEEQQAPQLPADASAAEEVDAKGRRRVVDWASVQRDGFEAEVSVRSSRCWVAMTAWYDANGDGVVDDADYVATLPSTEVADRGLCLGNVTWAGPITMRRRGPAR
jgi:hypothetical protein